MSALPDAYRRCTHERDSQTLFIASHSSAWNLLIFNFPVVHEKQQFNKITGNEQIDRALLILAIHHVGPPR